MTRRRLPLELLLAAALVGCGDSAKQSQHIVKPGEVADPAAGEAAAAAAVKDAQAAINANPKLSAQQKAEQSAAVEANAAVRAKTRAAER